MWLERFTPLTILVGGILLLEVLIVLPIVILYWSPGGLRNNVAKNPKRAMFALLLLGIMTELQVLGFRVILPFLFFVAGLVMQLYLLGWLYWEGKNRITFRRRSLFMGVLYAMLAVNITSGYFELRSLIPEPPVRAKVARAKADIRNLAVALEMYYIDLSSYPPAVDANGKIVPFKADGSTVSAGYVPWVLTTPVAYMASLPFDPYPDKKKKGTRLCYRYATNGVSCWIMTSPGPDLDDDIPIEEYPHPEIGGCQFKQFMSLFGGLAVEYDGTNGTTSSGDIVRVGP